MYHSFIKVGEGHHALNLLICGVIQQRVYETIHDVDDLRKRLIQIWFEFDQDVVDAVIDEWHDRVRLCECWWQTH